jgi:hypothetical protein
MNRFKCGIEGPDCRRSLLFRREEWNQQNSPLDLRDRLLPQGLFSLNLFRSFRTNSRLSTHVQLHGAFDYNRTPPAPPATRVHETTSSSTKSLPLVSPGLHMQSTAGTQAPPPNTTVVTVSGSMTPQRHLSLTNRRHPRVVSNPSRPATTRDLIHAL